MLSDVSDICLLEGYLRVKLRHNCSRKRIPNNSLRVVVFFGCGTFRCCLQNKLQRKKEASGLQN